MLPRHEHGGPRLAGQPPLQSGHVATAHPLARWRRGCRRCGPRTPGPPSGRTRRPSGRRAPGWAASAGPAGQHDRRAPGSAAAAAPAPTARPAPGRRERPATWGRTLRTQAQVRPTSRLLLRTPVRLLHIAARTGVRCQPICRTPVRPCTPTVGRGVTAGGCRATGPPPDRSRTGVCFGLPRQLSCGAHERMFAPGGGRMEGKRRNRWPRS